MKLSYISEAVKAGLNVLMGALCFIKIDHDVALLPNNVGGIEKVDYYYSIYDKLLMQDLQFLVYIALAVMVASVALSVAACIVKGARKIRLASYIVFSVSVLFFIGLLFYSMAVLKLNY